MRIVLTALAMLLVLGAFPASALAQQPQAGPDADRMAQMMKMIEQMQGQMKQMHEQMMAQMQGQMKQMREQMMGQMQGHMKQMREQMQGHTKACHGPAAAPEPK